MYESHSTIGPFPGEGEAFWGNLIQCTHTHTQKKIQLPKNFFYLHCRHAVLLVDCESSRDYMPSVSWRSCEAEAVKSGSAIIFSLFATTVYSSTTRLSFQISKAVFYVWCLWLVFYFFMFFFLILIFFKIQKKTFSVNKRMVKEGYKLFK